VPDSSWLFRSSQKAGGTFCIFGCISKVTLAGADGDKVHLYGLLESSFLNKNFKKCSGNDWDVGAYLESPLSPCRGDLQQLLPVDIMRCGLLKRALSTPKRRPEKFPFCTQTRSSQLHFSFKAHCQRQSFLQPDLERGPQMKAALSS
jgi:hypothetical protein